jgi:hypothetical protein
MASRIHQAMYTARAVDIFHVVELMKDVSHLPVIALVFCTMTDYQGHFSVLVGEINIWKNIEWNVIAMTQVLRVRFMVFNVTFNNISVISWRSVLLVEETRVPGENYQPVESHWQPLSHNVVSSTPCHEQGSSSQLLWC